jgi:hypothetical protein
MWAKYRTDTGHLISYDQFRSVLDFVGNELLKQAGIIVEILEHEETEQC